MPAPTLFCLENSRAFRVAWLANELGVDLNVRYYPRIEGKKAIPEMARDSGYTLGKSPCIQDVGPKGEELSVVESGNCLQYLAERYKPGSPLFPSTDNFAARTAVIGWIDFAETIMTHSLPIIYAQWFARPGDEGAVENFADKASGNVHKDLALVEEALQKGQYLCGDAFTAADIAVAFSCEYVIVKKVGIKDGEFDFPKIVAWLKRLEEREAYRKTYDETIKSGVKYDFNMLKL